MNLRGPTDETIKSWVIGLFYLVVVTLALTTPTFGSADELLLFDLAHLSTADRAFGEPSEPISLRANFVEARLRDLDTFPPSIYGPRPRTEFIDPAVAPFTGRANQAARHPGAITAIHGAILDVVGTDHAYDKLLWSFRLLSILALLPLPWLLWELARALRPDDLPFALVVVFSVLAVPAIATAGSSIGQLAPGATLAAAWALGAVGALRGNPRQLLLLGAAAAALMVVTDFGWVFLPGTVYAALRNRSHPDRIVVAGGAMLGAAIAIRLVTVTEFGLLTRQQETSRLGDFLSAYWAEAVHAAGGLMEFRTLMPTWIAAALLVGLTIAAMWVAESSRWDRGLIVLASPLPLTALVALALGLLVFSSEGRVVDVAGHLWAIAVLPVVVVAAFGAARFGSERIAQRALMAMSITLGLTAWGMVSYHWRQSGEGLFDTAWISRLNAAAPWRWTGAVVLVLFVSFVVVVALIGRHLMSRPALSQGPAAAAEAPSL